MSGLFDYLPLALKRLRSRPFLFFLFVVTTALAIGFTASIPLLAGAISQRILQQEIDVRANTRGWPVFAVRISARPTSQTPMGVAEAAATREWLATQLRGALRLPIRTSYVELRSPMFRLAPSSARTSAGQGAGAGFTSQYLAGVQAVHVLDIAPHLRTIAGAPYGAVADDQQLHAWLEASFAERLTLDVGDRLELGDLYAAAGQGLPVVVAGLWQAADPTDPFWLRPPATHFDAALLVTAKQFDALIAPRALGRADMLAWYFVMDDRALNLDRVDAYSAGLTQTAREAGRRLPGGVMDLDPQEDLWRGQQRKTALTRTLFVLSLPVLLIMLSFLASLAATQTRDQAGEFAIFVSRGAGRRQVLGLAAVEALLIAGLALPVGLALALALTTALGFATGFLAFALETASGISLARPLQAGLHAVDWRPIVAVIGIGLVVRVAAAWRISHVNLAGFERQQARPAAWWPAGRLGVIAVLVAATAYAYQQMATRGAETLASLALLDPRRDPLAALAPTLFIFVAPLVASELLVWLIRPADQVGRRLPWPAAYLALANLARAGSEYRAPAYRLILCLTLGVFYASLARSADIWLVDLLQHQYGADLTFRIGQPGRNAFAGFSQTNETDADAAAMLPSDEYLRIPGVAAAARVGDFEATISSATRIPYFRLLAVERTNFPQVAYFRKDYAAEPLGELMNRLALVSNGILLPRATAGQMAIVPGDTLPTRVHLQEDSWLQLNFKVAGLFDALPTVYPDDRPALVADLAYLELNTAGALPHTVWLRLAPGAVAEQVIREIRLRHVAPKEIRDLGQALATEAQRLERTGIFGILTVCFIAGVVLAAADLLVYSAYRLRQRGRANAILRALGVERGAILRTALAEDAVTVAYSLTAGIACGVCAAVLYAPFYTVGKTDGPAIPPPIPLIDWQRSDAIAVGVALTLIVAEALALLRLQRQRIFEALRMGAHV